MPSVEAATSLRRDGIRHEGIRIFDTPSPRGGRIGILEPLLRNGMRTPKPSVTLIPIRAQFKRLTWLKFHTLSGKSPERPPSPRGPCRCGRRPYPGTDANRVG